VLNLVRPEDKTHLFAEMWRALKPGGRAVISDIVCDSDPPEEMRNDPELWSGCISGAFREDTFVEMFARAGFVGMELLARQAEPWQVVGGIEFRSLTVRAYKPVASAVQPAMYRGPWKSVEDDAGNVYRRGEATRVCPDGPHAEEFIFTAAGLAPTSAPAKQGCC